MSWSTSELRVRLAPLNRFKPSSKIFYWPFQGGTSFVDLLCFCSVLCLLCLCARLVICALWSPAGKGLTSWHLFVVSTVSWSLSHWYPGSGVVLDCIDSWSLHPYLLWHKWVNLATIKCFVRCNLGSPGHTHLFNVSNSAALLLIWLLAMVIFVSDPLFVCFEFLFYIVQSANIHLLE